MCGIVGYVGRAQAAPVLLEGLEKLAYRGYDSAGIAVWDGAGREIQIAKAQGRLENLVRRTDAGRVMPGFCGVGHTRWATHGKPVANNAHPHCSPGRRVVLVHNGIVENDQSLRQFLTGRGYVFQSETDTEAAAILLDLCYAGSSGGSPEARALDAIGNMTRRICGSFAFGILFGDQPGVIYAVRRDSPLVIGRCAEGGYILASDAPALLGRAREVVYPENLEIACLTANALRLFGANGQGIERPFEHIAWEAASAEKGGYAHYMLKEMMEQPRAVRDTLAPRIAPESGRRRLSLHDAGLDASALRAVQKVWLIGCGSAYYAGVAGRAVIEQLAGIRAEAELGSEMRYRQPAAGENELAVIVSQSGETADSLAALRRCRELGMRTLAIVNVVGSSIAREADCVLYTWAGPEIAVATTKGYSTQLAALDMLAIALAAARRKIDPEREQALLEQLCALPEKMEQALACGEAVQRFARQIGERKDVFLIGRGLDAAICLEGSLKLKEVACIHAEAYPAGELKHGTLSLIEAGVPVIGVATQENLLLKTVSGMAEAKARGACLLGVSLGKQDALRAAADEVIALPDTEPLFAAQLAVIPLQMLAYELGCMRGLDVDRPRNLAKSVTVE